ncbi:MAG: hypothetical protein KC457_28780, partial [Myxococcales bacterium]|nr:hypothetical protein [Myxococcales bacterium]
MRRWPVMCLALALLPACNDDTTTTDNDSVGDLETMGEVGSTGDSGDATGTTDGTSTDGTSTDGTTGTDDTTTGETDTGGEWPEFTPFDQANWARGDISIDRVEVNQGIALTLVENGQVLPAKLVKDRNTLIQVFWNVPGNWQARPI